MIKRLCKTCGELIGFLWGWLWVTLQMLYGIIKISKAPLPRVTFFGGARLKADDKYALAAAELAKKLAAADISIITGGGPGLMEAASCGAQSAGSSKAKILGIAVRGVESGSQTSCATDIVVMRHFFARKWLLSRYSTAFVVFPGGFGTLDEMTEVVTLMQTGKLGRVPIVLFGKDYWEYFIKWLHKSALACDLITEEDLKLIVVCDSVDEAYAILGKECLGDQCPII